MESTKQIAAVHVEWLNRIDMIVKRFLYLGIAGLLFACGQSGEKLAQARLELARTLYEKGDTVAALAHADSVRILYRSAVREVNAAGEFKKTVYSNLLFRKQDELDTLKQVVAQLEKNFTKEKTEFDLHARYVHKRQDPEKRWNKSYLQVYVNEPGELGISSNYYGEEWLDHTGIRVYDGDLQAKTEKVELDNVLNHHSDFMNVRWEKVTYPEGTDGGVIDLIATHADRKLKAVFLGKRQYYIVLEDFDKQAVTDAVNLSKALKKQAALEAEIKALQ